MRRGRGFSYRHDSGRPVRDHQTLERTRSLAIPPAWEDVWICPDPLGHLQATGIDAAGRKQYLYHERWRERRDHEKFERMERFAAALPKLRRGLAAELRRGPDPSRERVLACAVRLLDVGLFRIGGEQYADDDHGVGLATVAKDHVAIHGKQIAFDYPAKGGVRRRQVIRDPVSGDMVRLLKRRRAGGRHLLAYRDGRRWVDVRSDDISDYLKRQIGDEFTAKDFRTWNATVVAAVAVAIDGVEAPSRSARKRTADRAVRGVADLLGNTPAVARRAYIDPRVFDHYSSWPIVADTAKNLRRLRSVDDGKRAQLERAVLTLLSG